MIVEIEKTYNYDQTKMKLRASARPHTFGKGESAHFWYLTFMAANAIMDR